MSPWASPLTSQFSFFLLTRWKSQRAPVSPPPALTDTKCSLRHDFPRSECPVPVPGAARRWATRSRARRLPALTGWAWRPGGAHGRPPPVWLSAVFSPGAPWPSFRGPVLRDPGPGLWVWAALVPCGLLTGRAFMWVPAALPGQAWAGAGPEEGELQVWKTARLGAAGWGGGSGGSASQAQRRETVGRQPFPPR